MTYYVSHDRKHVALDALTESFLSSLRSLRKGLKLSSRDVARDIGISSTTILTLENYESLPYIKTLIKLAEYYGVDLSGSLNYKYFHGQIDFAVLRQELRERGLTYADLGYIIGYSEESVYATLNNKPTCSLACLSAVIEALKEYQK